MHVVFCIFETWKYTSVTPCGIHTRFWQDCYAIDTHSLIQSAVKTLPARPTVGQRLNVRIHIASSGFHSYLARKTLRTSFGHIAPYGEPIFTRLNLTFCNQHCSMTFWSPASMCLTVKLLSEVICHLSGFVRCNETETGINYQTKGEIFPAT